MESNKAGFFSWLKWGWTSSSWKWDDTFFSHSSSKLNKLSTLSLFFLSGNPQWWISMFGKLKLWRWWFSFQNLDWKNFSKEIHSISIPNFEHESFFLPELDPPKCFSKRMAVNSFWWESYFDNKKNLGGGFKYFFIFRPIWGRFPFWLIFFRWVGSTTNQKRVDFMTISCR